ncbi:MAG: SCO family protein [Azonexus sp.]|nr:SCO family protein [Azonexus sp.]
MSEKVLVSIAALLAALLLGAVFFWEPLPPPGVLPKAGLPAGGDFSLDAADKKVALQDFRGKVVVLYFGYTYCPDICPTALSTLADALAQLEPRQQAAIQPVFISVDPERDTPQHLATYVRFFHPGLIGVTGTAAEIADLARRYQVIYTRQPAAGEAGKYTVDHSSELILLDRQGRPIDRIAHGSSSQRIAQVLREALSAP